MNLSWQVGCDDKMNGTIYKKLEALDRKWVKNLDCTPLKADFTNDADYFAAKSAYLEERRKIADEAFDLIASDFNGGRKIAAIIWDHIIEHYSDEWFTIMYKYFLNEAKLAEKILEVANDDKRKV